MLNATESFFSELIGFIDASDSEKSKLERTLLPSLKSQQIVSPFEIQKRATNFLDSLRTPYMEKNAKSIERGGFDGEAIELPDTFYDGPLEILIKMEGNKPEEGFVDYQKFAETVFDSLSEDERKIIYPLLKNREIDDRQYSLETIEKFLPHLKRKVQIILERSNGNALDFIAKKRVKRFKFTENNLEVIYRSGYKDEVVRKAYNALIQGASYGLAYKIATGKINNGDFNGSIIRRWFPNFSPVAKSVLFPYTASMFLEKRILFSAEKKMSVYEASKFALVSSKTVRKFYHAISHGYFSDLQKGIMEDSIKRGIINHPIFAQGLSTNLTEGDFLYYKKIRDHFSQVVIDRDRKPFNQF
ncbi:MAG TPA: hypothetical protein VJZ93_03660 [Candidatus Nanoarchaeia archaeon]|nr:hypothetical protein [Candidatus Nanoarchaeia archaeon]